MFAERSSLSKAMKFYQMRSITIKVALDWLTNGHAADRRGNAFAAANVEWGYRGEMSLKLWYHHLAQRGLGQLLNYDIIEFPEEGNTKSSNQREFPSLKSGRGQMVSTQEQETLQLRALKLQTSIKGTFPLFTLTLCSQHIASLNRQILGRISTSNCSKYLADIPC